MTKIKPLLAVLLIISLPTQAISQITPFVETGFSYIEHFSIGAGVTSPKHSAAILYGSNFFIHKKKFSNVFLEYQYSISKLKFSMLTPVVGVKGGRTIFSDQYYTWNVVSVIPFAGLSRPITPRLQVLMHVGVAFSFEQSVIRLKFGEIGHYRNRLPEFKAGLHYNLKKS